MNFNFTRQLAVLAAISTAVASNAASVPSFLLSSHDGTAYETLILAQFPSNGSVNVSTYLNYGRVASASKVVGLADFNADDVLDLVIAAKVPATNTFKWQVWLMADNGTAAHGRQNYSPTKKLWIDPINNTLPDAFSVSLGTLTNGSGKKVFYIKNPTTGDIRGEEITLTSTSASVSGESIYTVENTEWTKAVSVFSDPLSPSLPAFTLVYKTGTIAGVYHSFNSTYQILLNNNNTSVNFGTTTSPAASLDINGDGNEDILAVPQGRARRAWLLDAAISRSANLTVLGARPFQIEWNVVAWAGGTKH
jgi:hypothetical protein